MKKTVSLLLALLLAHAVYAGKIYIGPTVFKPGDGITIEQVRSSSLDFKPGDTVIVRGSYKLSSRPAAKIGISLTKPDSKTQLRPEGSLQLITSGFGEFELQMVVPTKGYLNICFYPGDKGLPFGGIYFGSEAQMKEIKGWKLSEYLRR